MSIFAQSKSVYRFLFIKRGKSGQYRAPYFLTGRANLISTESATERKTTLNLLMGKGEKVG